MSESTEKAAWRSGCLVGGAVAWLFAAVLLAGFARLTAIVPPAEPLHSQYEAEANSIALRIFAVAATPGAIVLLILGALKKLDKR